MQRIFYPKNVVSINSGEFGIFIANVKTVLPDSEGQYGKNIIKLKGVCPTIEYGSKYRVYCVLSEVNQYGETYEIVYMNKIINISSADKQKEFLRKILNETLVDRLFEKYDDVIKLLEEENIEELTSIKGIGEQVAKRMIDEYNESKDFSEIYIELGSLGLTSAFIHKLTEHFSSPSTVIDVIKHRPYDLVQVDGVGFKKADEIALKIGIGQYDEARIKGYINHFLNEQGEEGKSYVSYQELMGSIYDVLGFVPEEILAKVAKSMVDNDEILVFENGAYLALKKYYDLEKSIMNELLRLHKGVTEEVDVESDCDFDEELLYSGREMFKYKPKITIPDDYEKVIADVEFRQGYEFTEEQRNAIEMSIKENVIILTSMAGGGKTSTANGICAMYKDCSVTGVALSGKASVRLQEATGLPSSTIHRALGWSFGGFTYNKDNQLATDIVIIDEATMINGTLFNALLQAIPTGAKVIIMGDVQQLTPIGNCQVFADILNANTLPIVRLTKPHRQALRSGIIPTSMNVATQKSIFENGFTGHRILGELEDMELNIGDKTTDYAQMIVDYVQTEMKRLNNIMEIQVCVAKKLDGALSCYNLNTIIQDLVNPKMFNGYEVEIQLSGKKKSDDDEVKKYILRKGDKVINIKNNYNCLTENGSKTAVFNGNIGVITDIDESLNCHITFEGIGDVVFGKTDCKNLRLAYACTTHSMQGSGFTSVIVGMDSSSYIMNNSELLYTAITRAKKYCVLVGSNVAIDKAIKTKEVNKKQTFLQGLLETNMKSK